MKTEHATTFMKKVDGAIISVSFQPLPKHSIELIIDVKDGVTLKLSLTSMPEVRNFLYACHYASKVMLTTDTNTRCKYLVEFETMTAFTCKDVGILPPLTYHQYGHEAWKLLNESGYVLLLMPIY